MPDPFNIGRVRHPIFKNQKHALCQFSCFYVCHLHEAEGYVVREATTLDDDVAEIITFEPMARVPYNLRFGLARVSTMKSSASRALSSSPFQICSRVRGGTPAGFTGNVAVEWIMLASLGELHWPTSEATPAGCLFHHC